MCSRAANGVHPYDCADNIALPPLSGQRPGDPNGLRLVVVYSQEHTGQVNRATLARAVTRVRCRASLSAPDSDAGRAHQTMPPHWPAAGHPTRVAAPLAVVVVDAREPTT